MQPISLLIGILILQSTCILFVLIDRADITAKVARELVPHMSDMSRTMDATRLMTARLCDDKRKHRIHHNNISGEFDFLNAFPHHELTDQLQRSEALALFALVRMLMPRRILLINYNPATTRTFLAAASPQALVTAVSAVPELSAMNLLQTHPNFKFSSAGPEHFPLGKTYDFVFFQDPTHFNTNIRAFQRLTLAPNCVVAIHNTGLHMLIPPPNNSTLPYNPSDPTAQTTNKGAGIPHHPEAIRLAEWILDYNPTWTKFDILSIHVWRHGISLLQERRAVEEEDY